MFKVQISFLYVSMIVIRKQNINSTYFELWPIALEGHGTKSFEDFHHSEIECAILVSASDKVLEASEKQQSLLFVQIHEPKPRMSDNLIVVLCLNFRLWKVVVCE